VAHILRVTGLKHWTAVGLVAAAVVAGAACKSDEITATGVAGEGQQLAESKGCTACHTPDGNKAAGPSWKGLWESQVTLEDGPTVTADRGYIIESIRQPQAKIRKDSVGQMPKGDLTNEEIEKVIAYIMTLK